MSPLALPRRRHASKHNEQKGQNLSAQQRRQKKTEEHIFSNPNVMTVITKQKRKQILPDSDSCKLAVFSTVSLNSNCTTANSQGSYSTKTVWNKALITIQ